MSPGIELVFDVGVRLKEDMRQRRCGREDAAEKIEKVDFAMVCRQK